MFSISKRSVIVFFTVVNKSKLITLACTTLCIVFIFALLIFSGLSRMALPAQVISQDGTPPWTISFPLALAISQDGTPPWTAPSSLALATP